MNREYGANNMEYGSGSGNVYNKIGNTKVDGMLILAFTPDEATLI